MVNWPEGQAVSPATIAKNNVLLSAIFTTALNDHSTPGHPGALGSVTLSR
jgi:hypothetical protein